MTLSPMLCAALVTAGLAQPPDGLLRAGEEPAPETAVESAEKAVVRPAGVRIFRDPETGELGTVPTEQQLERLSPSKLVPRRSSWELEAFSLRGGGTGVVLDGWADHELAVRRTVSGALETFCARGDAHPPAPSSAETSPADRVGLRAAEKR